MDTKSSVFSLESRPSTALEYLLELSLSLEMGIFPNRRDWKNSRPEIPSREEFHNETQISRHCVRREQVSDTIALLRLQSCACSKVGSPRARGVSVVPFKDSRRSATRARVRGPRELKSCGQSVRNRVAGGSRETRISVSFPCRLRFWSRMDRASEKSRVGCRSSRLFPVFPTTGSKVGRVLNVYQVGARDLRR